MCFTPLLLFLLLTQAILITVRLLGFYILLLGGFAALGLLLLFCLAGIKAPLVSIIDRKCFELWGGLNILLHFLAVFDEGG